MWLLRELVDDPARPMDFAGDEERELDVGRDRPSRLFVIAPIARHRLLVSVEEQADDPEVPVEDRAPRISTGGVVRGYEVDGKVRALLLELFVPPRLAPPPESIRQSVVAAPKTACGRPSRIARSGPGSPSFQSFRVGSDSARRAHRASSAGPHATHRRDRSDRARVPRQFLEVAW